jgi:hypothetical protein
MLGGNTSDAGGSSSRGDWRGGRGCGRCLAGLIEVEPVAVLGRLTRCTLAVGSLATDVWNWNLLGLADVVRRGLALPLHIPPQPHFSFQPVCAWRTQKLQLSVLHSGCSRLRKQDGQT